MPTYQYACTNPSCGANFELVQSFTDHAASQCPTCGGPVRKVFSAVGVVFKGSGFYRTDSRSGNGSSAKSPPHRFTWAVRTTMLRARSTPIGVGSDARREEDC